MRDEDLHGNWVNSHEEDTENQLVFRREGFPFPPARGRSSIELRTDGTYAALSPGPVDVPLPSTGTWKLDSNRLVLAGDESAPASGAWMVSQVSDDRLILRRLTE